MLITSSNDIKITVHFRIEYGPIYMSSIESCKLIDFLEIDSKLKNKKLKLTMATKNKKYSEINIIHQWHEILYGIHTNESDCIGHESHGILDKLKIMKIEIKLKELKQRYT
jgi:hypothetical protein